MNKDETDEYISADPVPRKIAKSGRVIWGYTYFIRRGDAIKIGHSAAPKDRIAVLQASFPDRLDILAVVQNTIVNEVATHRKFDHLRTSGEWFRAEPELLQFIESIKPHSEPVERFAPMAEPKPAPGLPAPKAESANVLAELIMAYETTPAPSCRGSLGLFMRQAIRDAEGRGPFQSA